MSSPWTVSRPGARWSGFPGSVSPGRSPNRTCDSHRIRLSTGLMPLVRNGDRNRLPPNGAVWSASPVPAPAVPGHSPRRLRALQFPSVESCYRPSPCGRLSRPRTTTAAPPRPGPIGRRWAQPGDPRWRRGPWQEPERFPCSLIVDCRRRSPAIPPRHRHGYAADFHRGLPRRPS